MRHNVKHILLALVIVVLAVCILVPAFFFNTFFTNAPIADESDGYIRLDVTRDTWVSSYQGETEGSNGGADRLKVKGHQEMTLLDIDPSLIAGRVIEHALLRVKVVNPKVPLKRVGISTISAEWTEGNGSRYAKIRGASTFSRRAYPDVSWIEGGVNESGYSDLTQVMFGEGGTFWSHSDASPPDADGWQTIEVDPKILAARAAGLSSGFVVFDDTGTELIRRGDNGENVKIDIFPNRFFYSREKNSTCAPYFKVRFAEKTAPPPPSAPMNLSVETGGLPVGEAMIRWEIPAREQENIIGFHVNANGREAPRALIPAPSFTDNANPQAIAMRLRDLSLKPGQTVWLEVTAVNETGQIGSAATLSFSIPDDQFSIPVEFIRLDASSEKITPVKEYILRLSGSETATLAILDELDKVTERGEITPKQPASYFTKNHIWNASENRIRLYAARNEFTGFQIYLSGNIPHISPRFQWEAASEITTTAAPDVGFSRFGYVASPIGNVPDPVIPLTADARLNINGNISILCEIYVPKSTTPGSHYGTLSLMFGDELIYSADVEFTVWDFELPDKLNFLPEMNCYNLPENERDYYRMANLHRTYINRVPYSHRGTVSRGCAPEWNAESRTFDWAAWDLRFSDYFDGSAFSDLPRGQTPIEAFYLPIFENFPADIFTHYNGSQWATEAFSDEYRETFQAAAREFAKHFIEQNWNRTCFQFFLNNKMDYKRDGWSRASSPWLLDEPSSYQDFAALKFFGELFLKGVNSLSSITNFQAKSPIRFRADISRPQWQRDSLDNSLGVNVVGGGEFHRYNRMIIDRKERFGQTLYTYGTTCAPEEGAYQPVIWSLDAWSRGADGILPWQTIGTADSWKTSDALALFYPKPQVAGEELPEVLPSLRLKGYRRGQQDVEYLTLLLKKLNRPRHDIEGLVRAKLNLISTNRVNSAEDAGTLRYDSVSAQDLWEFRMNVARTLQEPRFNDSRLP